MTLTSRAFALSFAPRQIMRGDSLSMVNLCVTKDDTKFICKYRGANVLYSSDK